MNGKIDREIIGRTERKDRNTRKWHQMPLEVTYVLYVMLNYQEERHSLMRVIENDAL